MRFLTDRESAAWCAERGFPTRSYEGYAGLRADLAPTGFHFAKFRLPRDSGKKVWLGRALYGLVEPSPELLMWLADWAVWPSSQHEPLYARFREALGEHRSLIETPGHVATPIESDDAVSIIVVALLFFWDCHIISSSGRDAVFVSHDEHGWFGSREASVTEFASRRIQQGLNSGTA